MKRKAVRNSISCNAGFLCHCLSFSLSLILDWRRSFYYEAMKQLYAKIFWSAFDFILFYTSFFHLSTMDFLCILSILMCSGRALNPEITPFHFDVKVQRQYVFKNFILDPALSIYVVRNIAPFIWKLTFRK